ncbi:hypothetical protein MTR67_035203 [Solanum verrucosum]|uniref:Reverse transcriptase zinc-binding domain-containing protein n=1 Tax=Solanum verrucosum TaxID=315347 RepID=A0AAF0U9P7_SOLVR|nr:hypothetical protein MTR67_035203 [Solanum verrucosum]
MMKWLWKFADGDNMLLKDVITANYGMSDEWMTSMVAILYGCTMWRAIRNLWPLKLSRTRIKVYPALLSLCQQQQATVAAMWTGQAWNVQLRRHLNDREMEIIASFHNTMAEFNNLTMEGDRLDRVGEAKSWNKVSNAAKKEERWKIVPACSWWQLVDSEEGKEQKML